MQKNIVSIELLLKSNPIFAIITQITVSRSLPSISTNEYCSTARAVLLVSK